MTLFAAAVPVGAVVAISNNDGDSVPRVNSGNAGNNGDNGGGGGMTGGALPTTTISSPTDNNDGTITWTVTFSRSVASISASDFSVSDGMVASVSSTSGTTVMVTTTHTSDGMVTLTYMGMGAMDRTSTAFNFMLPPEINYIENLPTSAGSVVSSGTSSVSVLRSMDSGMVTLGGTDYTFTSPTSRTGMAVSSNNQLAILQAGDATAGISTFIVGTNVDRQGTQATDISQVNVISHGTTTTRAQAPSSGTVTYTGDYIVGRVPTAMDSIENSIATGEISLTADFSNNTLTGSATDENNAASGMFTSGVVTVFTGLGAIFGDLVFNGTGTLDYATNITLDGNFIGDNAAHLAGTGRNAAADSNGNHIVMGIVASR